MENKYRFWKVIYEHSITGKMLRSCVSATSEKSARREAKRRAKHTAWRVKSVTELPQIGEAS